MWPFGKSKPDYDGLGLALLQKGSEYQTPTVDGIYAYLLKSGQLQYRDEITEKRILNVAAACVVTEHVLLRARFALPNSSPHAKVQVQTHFYGYVRKLAGMSFADHSLRIEEGEPLMMRLIPEAASEYPPGSGNHGDPKTENLTYELVRAVIALHVRWLSGRDSRVNLPTAVDDWRELSQAGEGLARAQRWIESSLGKQIQKTLTA